MKYEKPEIVSVGTAVKSIQNGQLVKRLDTPVDHQENPDVFETTISAYEGDE